MGYIMDNYSHFQLLHPGDLC